MDLDNKFHKIKPLTRRDKKIAYLRKMRREVHNVCTICGGKYTYGNDKNHISTNKHIKAIAAHNEKIKDEDAIKKLRGIGDNFSKLTDFLLKNEQLPNDQIDKLTIDIKEYYTLLDHVDRKVRILHNKVNNKANNNAPIKPNPTSALPQVPAEIAHHDAGSDTNDDIGSDIDDD
jgi:hypothetical protein